jgi:large subunit ribosomal protein L13
MKTYATKKKEGQRKWHLVDAGGRLLGRLATEISSLLIGKNKLVYAPHIDVGDFVVVINAGKVKVSGRKFEKKMYHHYSGYPGGLKSKSFREKFKENPKWVIWQAVKGMLPANRLRVGRLKRLKIYEDEKHPHEAQLKKK